MVAAVDALRRGEAGSTDVVALSFDDGYRDVAANALPVLERHGFRATVFVSPAVVDGTATFTWYDDQPPVLGLERDHGLDGGSPLTFEAHTLTHPDLTALDDDAAEREIAGSQGRARGTARPSRARLLLPGRPVRAA